MIDAEEISVEPREQLARAAAFLRRMLRAWRPALSVLVIGAIACAAFLWIRKPSFRSETIILYSEVARPGDEGERPTTARSVTLRLREILMSRASLATVVHEFDLYPDIQRARGLVEATEELKKHIDFRAPGGDTFSIAFTGTSPTEAQAVTARLASVIIAQDADLRKKQASSLRDFLESERRSTQDALREAELALASFMAAHPRFALDATPLATGAAIRATLGGGGGEAAPAPGAGRTVRARPRHLAASAEEGSHATSEVPTAPREAAAEEERAQADLAAAKSNLLELAARFTPAHPDVRAAQAEVERATRRLAAATAAMASSGSTVSAPPPARSLPAAIAVAPSPPVHAAHAANSSEHASPTHAAAGTPSASDHDVVALETEWVKLTRATTEARQQEDQVEAALFKTKSAADAENGDGVQVTMIDPAFAPQSPVPPGRLVIVALFAAGALLLAAVMALLRALLDDRVYEERDVEQCGDLLVAIPRRAHV